MARAAIEHKDVFIPGPAGRLEAVLERSRNGDPRARAVVCHPDPRYGGTLNNKVAFTLARAACEAGAAALRFNFRGVGKSEGVYDGGRGETKDLRAAERWLADRFPDLPCWRFGFSFGAAIALAASAVEPCAVLVTVAPPVGRLADYGFGHAALRAGRWLLIQGARDEVVSAQAVLDWAHALAPGPEIEVFADTGHYFHGRLTELRRRVLAALATEETKEMEG